jgi:hypothetical protein
MPSLSHTSSWRGAQLSRGYVFMAWDLVKHTDKFNFALNLPVSTLGLERWSFRYVPGRWLFRGSSKWGARTSADEKNRPRGSHRPWVPTQAESSAPTSSFCNKAIENGRKYLTRILFWSSDFIRRVTLEVLSNVSEDLTASIFFSEDGSRKFLRNVAQYLQYYTAYKVRRSTSENLTSYLAWNCMSCTSQLVLSG